MPAKPTSIPLWCTQNAANMQAPPASLIASGWLPGQPLPAAFANYSANLTGQWIAYLAAAQNSTQVVDAVQPAIRLLEGGRWSFASATSTLTWSADAFISFAGLTDAQNTLKAGSVTIPAGSVAFVQSNAPFVDQGGTTAGSTTITGLSYADQLSAGWTVSGTGIPANATIQSIDTTAKTLTLSAAATATGSGVRLVFTGSGPLTAQVADVASFAPTANTVVFARATATNCIVGVGSGQMLVAGQESKQLLGAAYVSKSQVYAGADLTFGTPVYCSQGTDGRSIGYLYPCDASAQYGAQRAQFMGFVHTDCASGNLARVVSSGTITLSRLTVGATYYLDPVTPGRITSTRPTGLLQYVMPVGVAIDAQTLLLTGAADRAPRTLDSILTHATVDMGSVAVISSSYTANYNLFFSSVAWNGSAASYAQRWFWPQRSAYVTDLAVSMSANSAAVGAGNFGSSALLSLGYETQFGQSPNSGILVTQPGQLNYRSSAGYSVDLRSGQYALSALYGYYFIVSFGSAPVSNPQAHARMTIAY